SSSVQGLQVIQNHFTAGETGPITVLLASHTDWESTQAQALLSHLSQAMARLDNVAEVRSLTQPLGVPLRRAAEAPAPEKAQGGFMGGFLGNLKRNWDSAVQDNTRAAARPFYLAEVPQLVGDSPWLREPSAGGPVHVTRLDVVLHS